MSSPTLPGTTLTTAEAVSVPLSSSAADGCYMPPPPASGWRPKLPHCCRNCSE